MPRHVHLRRTEGFDLLVAGGGPPSGAVTVRSIDVRVTQELSGGNELDPPREVGRVRLEGPHLLRRLQAGLPLIAARTDDGGYGHVCLERFLLHVHVDRDGAASDAVLEITDPQTSARGRLRSGEGWTFESEQLDLLLRGPEGLILRYRPWYIFVD